jgi:hypothetical protein
MNQQITDIGLKAIKESNFNAPIDLPAIEIPGKKPILRPKLVIETTFARSGSCAVLIKSGQPYSSYLAAYANCFFPHSHERRNSIALIDGVNFVAPEFQSSDLGTTVAFLCDALISKIVVPALQGSKVLLIQESGLTHLNQCPADFYTGSLGFKNLTEQPSILVKQYSN